MRDADLARLEHETTDLHQQLPATVRRLIWLDTHLWHQPSSDDLAIVRSGHTDPVGEQVVASQPDRRHLHEAARLLLQACAAARGAWAALDRAEHTIGGYDGTQTAADQAATGSMRGRCTVCNDHAATRRGRCAACNAWWTRHGSERPRDQWQQHWHG